ncbi:hypothetical protein ACFQY5_25110 [Paeniroseomonas aquatica]|uniref:Uncharacterized protein n=1 Tax=Paeniroseomonas aquatica TaxID=373043 RepID=A0ABT8A9K5_9PROT|nr:hypothetical protein [Paeniroseomonas aquatica]MDN3566313.1 hypothetical protein [Paeniroseomonas aquatica]
MTRLATGLLAATVALGVILGILYLGRVRKPLLIILHLLLGAAGIESLFVLLHWTPAGLVLPAGAAGPWAGGLLAAAMFLGLVARLWGRRAPAKAELLLATHAVAGVAGLLVFLSWAARL